MTHVPTRALGAWLCLHGAAALAAPVLVQQNEGYTSGTFSVSLPSPVDEGNALVVFMFWHHSSGSVSFSDSTGNTHAQSPVAVNSFGGPTSASVIQLFVAGGARGGPLTFTASTDAGTNAQVGLAVLEYAGLDPVSPLGRWPLSRRPMPRTAFLSRCK